MRTGLRNASTKFQRKFQGLPEVKSPVLSYKYGACSRSNKLLEKIPFDANRIYNAYLVDGPLRQGIDKYAEIVLKEGWVLKGGDAPLDYLKTRLALMSLMCKESFGHVIERAVRDFILYGNAFLIVQRCKGMNPIAGLNLKGIRGKTPIGGYFNLPVKGMRPLLDEQGLPTHWVQSIRNHQKEFPVDSIIHFTYCKEAGELWGMTPVLAVLDDVMFLRQIEENVGKLLHKHLNPLVHTELPDSTGDGKSTQEEMTEAVRSYQQMAPDGLVITPPGVKMSLISAGNGLDASSYLEYFKNRIYTGLGVSAILMGEGQRITGGSADTMAAQMHYRAKMYQRILGEYFTLYLFNELLLEGGFDPWNRSEDRVEWCWAEIELDRQVKMETHAMSMYTMNGISFHEMRNRCKDLDKVYDDKDFYLERVQIPQQMAGLAASDTSGHLSNMQKPTNQHKSQVGTPSAHKMSTEDPPILWENVKR